MNDTVTCPHCLREIVWPLPDQPMYSLDDARAILLVPTKGAMYTFIWRHRNILDKPRYAYEAGIKRQRILTASEIQRLKKYRRLSTKGVMQWLVSGE